MIPVAMGSYRFAGASTAKSVTYTESVNMTGVPDAQQKMAYNPGNKLNSKRHADLA